MEKKNIVIGKESVITINNNNITIEWLKYPIQSKIPNGNYKVDGITYMGDFGFHSSNGSSGSAPWTGVSLTNIKTKKSYSFTITKRPDEENRLVFVAK